MTGVPVRPASRGAIAVVHHLAFKTGIANMAMGFWFPVPFTIFSCVKYRHFRYLVMDSYLICPPYMFLRRVRLFCIPAALVPTHSAKAVVRCLIVTARAVTRTRRGAWQAYSFIFRDSQAGWPEQQTCAGTSDIQ